MALGGVLGSGLGAFWSRVTPWHFAWQAWHNLTSTFVSRGRRGAISHPPSFRVAGVALMALRGALGSGLVWHSGGDINSRPSIRLINKISTVVKLCRIDWFFGFIMCQDIVATR